jgi:GPH family glycoside/pentoside/hexuronide:cation symporter
MTCVSIPYLALLPEMATDYDERTSFNTFRAAAAVMGTLLAASMKPIADSMGGGSEAWWNTALMMSVWVVLPWFAVHAVSFERPGYQKNDSVGFLKGIRALGRHRAFRILAGFYILARIAVDLIGAMFLLYFTYAIGRPEDFAPCLGLFLGVVILVLPGWLAVARKRDKRSIFIFGAAWWSASQILIFLGDPDWPRWVMFAIPAVAALGYAVADLMPWAMLGEVIDEDELATGERREGMYVGCFMFLRKVGGATAVLAIGLVLELTGFVGTVERSGQTELALLTVRSLTSFVPMGLLLFAIAVATRYPLTRAVHAEILEGLRRRRELQDGF